MKFKCADVQRQIHRQQRAVVVNFHRFHHVYYFPNSNTASLFIPFYVFNGRCHDFTTRSFSCNSERIHSLFVSIGSRSRDKVKEKKNGTTQKLFSRTFDNCLCIYLVCKHLQCVTFNLCVFLYIEEKRAQGSWNYPMCMCVCTISEYIFSYCERREPFALHVFMPAISFRFDSIARFSFVFFCFPYILL